MVRIVVVHPARLVCSLYASVLDEKPNTEVVAQATEAAAALDELTRTRCDIALVSAMLPDNGALDLTRTITRDYPHTKVLVVGLPESKSAILQYVMAGASGYVLQDVTVDKLFDHIHAADSDKAIISPAIAAAFMDQIAELSRISAHPYLEPDAYAELTPRELEVLELIGEGRTNQEIGDQLFIEVGTVKNHVHNLLKKLDVSSREDAAAHLPFIQREDDSRDESI